MIDHWPERVRSCAVDESLVPASFESNFEAMLSTMTTGPSVELERQEGDPDVEPVDPPSLPDQDFPLSVGAGMKEEMQLKKIEQL